MLLETVPGDYCGLEKKRRPAHAQFPFDHPIAVILGVARYARNESYGVTEALGLTGESLMSLGRC